MRPIIVPRDVNALPWCAGYAETINAGKSRQNEDQACVREGRIRETKIVGCLYPFMKYIQWEMKKMKAFRC